MARRIVYHREAILADHPCDAGREEGLAQPRCAEQQQILPPRTEAGSKVPAQVQVPLGVFPWGAGQAATIRGIPVQLEGIKALAADVQHPAQLPDLLLCIVFFQAAAQAVAPIAGITAQGAAGLFRQVILRIAQLGQQLRPAPLQGEILIPDHPDGGQGIRATPQSGGDDLAHGTPDLPLDALQLRTLLIDLLLPLALLLLTALLVLVKAQGGLTQHLSVVCHGVFLLTTSCISPYGSRPSSPPAGRACGCRSGGPPPPCASRFRASGGGSR